MNKNFLLPILCLLVMATLGIFAFKSIKQIYNYYLLSESATMQVKNWNIKQIGKNKYALIAEFTYMYKDKKFEAKAPLGRIYPNPWAAQDGIKRISCESFICWFSPKQVEKPSLTKKFPLNSFISSLVLAAILLYFCGLTLYLRRGL